MKKDKTPCADKNCKIGTKCIDTTCKLSSSHDPNKRIEFWTKPEEPDQDNSKLKGASLIREEKKLYQCAAREACGKPECIHATPHSWREASGCCGNSTWCYRLFNDVCSTKGNGVFSTAEAMEGQPKPVCEECK